MEDNHKEIPALTETAIESVLMRLDSLERRMAELEAKLAEVEAETIDLVYDDLHVTSDLDVLPEESDYAADGDAAETVEEPASEDVEKQTAPVEELPSEDDSNEPVYPEHDDTHLEEVLNDGDTEVLKENEAQQEEDVVLNLAEDVMPDEGDLPQEDNSEEDMPDFFPTSLDMNVPTVEEHKALAKGTSKAETKSALVDIPGTKTAVMDALAEKQAWRTDMPGSPVKDIRSAIALNDRVMFIRVLFREDAELFNATLNKINAMNALADAETYLKSVFPEWKMDSDNVYRFMMAVRRKLRS